MSETEKKSLIITPEFTVGRWPNLFKPWAGKDPKPNDEAKFGTPVLGTAETIKAPEFKALQAAVVKAAKEKHGDKVKFTLNDDGLLVSSGNIRLPFIALEDDAYPAEYLFRINLKGGTTKPRVVSLYKGPDGKAQDIADERMVFPGCIIRASVNVSAYEFKEGGVVKSRGVSIYLANVVLIDADRPSLGVGHSSPDDDFGDLLRDGKMGGGADADDDLSKLLG